MLADFVHKGFKIRAFVTVPGYAGEGKHSWQEHIFYLLPVGDVFGPEIGLHALDVRKLLR